MSGTPDAGCDAFGPIAESCFSNSPFPMVVVSAGGLLLCHANPAFFRLIGDRASPELGRDFTGAFPPSTRTTLRDLVGRVLTSGQAERLDAWNDLGHEGVILPWTFQAWPWFHRSGSTLGVMIQVTDAAEELRFREQSRDMNEALILSSVRLHEMNEQAVLLTGQLQDAQSRLEERIAERTAELTASNAKLRGAIARGEAAERERAAVLAQLATVQEQERRAISRELHDQIGQLLAGLALAQKAVEIALPANFPARSRLEEIRLLTADISRKVHNLAVMLRPTVLDDLGLVPALSSYFHDWSARTGIGADFHSMGEMASRLPQSVENAFYRVALEAAANVQRHASATRVGVGLQVLPDRAILTVEDDGRGFDQQAVEGAGRLGLLGMRERIIQLGGELVIESGSGAGTTVIGRVPLKGRS